MLFSFVGGGGSPATRLLLDDSDRVNRVITLPSCAQTMEDPFQGTGVDWTVFVDDTDG